MLKVKTIVNFKGIEETLRDFKSTKALKPIAEDTLAHIKDNISRGFSSVRGVGRFVEYSGAKNPGNKTGYPFNVQKKFPSKRVRPVNLKLSGDMLSSLVSRVEGGTISIGIFDKVEAEKAIKHNDGTEKVPQRHFLPTKKGEQFTISIQRQLKALMVEVLGRIIKRNK